MIGVSGGVDSSYAAYLTKKMGLRPLAVHLDNGWNTECADWNVDNLMGRLKIDLKRVTVDWEEFRDLQLSFLKASTPDLEIPSDHAIWSISAIIAHKYKIPCIVTGSNLSSETILPTKWSHGHTDWRYIKSVQKQFGTRSLKNYPHLNLWDMYYFRSLQRFNILDYIDYDKEEAKAFLIKEFGWRDYGGKHCESVFTKFYQCYLLPQKFGYDKRRSHYSALIAAGQMTREEALGKMEEPLYEEKALQADMEYVTRKLGISKEELDLYIRQPAKKFSDYDNYEKSVIYRLLRFFGLYYIREY